MIFSNRRYLILSIIIFTAFFFVLSATSSFVFFKPAFVFYVPNDEILNFSLLVLISGLSAIVISMSVYRIRLLGDSITRSGTGFMGSVIGATAGACSCGPIGFAAVSVFGTVGSTATAFLTNYDTPLRLLSIGVLAVSYFFAVKGISAQCKIRK